jgi:hypothetical protein
MKPILPLRFLFPVGLLILAASFVLKHFVPVSDVADGFMKGLSISILIMSIASYAHRKSAPQQG